MTWLAGMGLVFSIASGNAAETLTRFSKQGDLQIVFDYNKLSLYTTSAVEGEFATAVAALDLMISGTEITYEVLEERTVVVDAPTRERTPGAYTENGHHYSCTPFTFSSGFALSRLGRLLLRVGEIPEDLMYCVEDGAITEADTHMASPIDEVVVTAPKKRRSWRWPWKFGGS